MSGPNPRKFADKIALLEMKSRDMSVQFQSIMQEVSETTRSSKLNASRHLHSSMPNLRQAAAAPAVPQQAVNHSAMSFVPNFAPSPAVQGAHLVVPMHGQRIQPLPQPQHIDPASYHQLQARKISAPAMVAGPRPHGSPYRLSAQQWQNTRSLSLELPKTVPSVEINSGIVDPTGQYRGLAVHEEYPEAVKSVFDQSCPGTLDTQVSAPVSDIRLKPSPAVEHSLLQSKTLSLPNLANGAASGPIPVINALDESAGVLYPNVIGGGNVPQSVQAMSQVHAFDPRRSGGGAMKQRRNASLLHLHGGHKPYASVSSTSVPNLKEVVLQQQNEQPSQDNIRSPATFSTKPSSSYSSRQGLPDDLSRAALNASSLPPFLDGSLSESASSNISVSAISSDPSQLSSLYPSSLHGIDSSTIPGLASGIDNTQLRSLMANLQLQPNSTLLSQGSPQLSTAGTFDTSAGLDLPGNLPLSRSSVLQHQASSPGSLHGSHPNLVSAVSVTSPQSYSSPSSVQQQTLLDVNEPLSSALQQSAAFFDPTIADFLGPPLDDLSGTNLTLLDNPHFQLPGKI